MRSPRRASPSSSRSRSLAMGRRIVTRSTAARGELFVVPLTDGGRGLGALVLGRTEGRYEGAEEELAGVLGRFIARLVSRAATRDRGDERRSQVVVPEPEVDREWAEEPQLA